MIVYLAGPMRSKPQYNIPAFEAAAFLLRGAGLTVISPVELDAAYGLDLPNLDFKTITKELVCQCVRRDVEALTCCDAIVMLEDWEQSKGASAERAIAEWIGLTVFDSVSDAFDRLLYVEELV